MRTVVPFLVLLIALTVAILVQQAVVGVDPTTADTLCNGLWGCGPPPMLDLSVLGALTVLFVFLLPDEGAGTE